MEAITYSYSTDCERFYGSFCSYEEAKQEAISENEDGDIEVVYVGRNVRPNNKDFMPDAALIIEHMDISAYDHAGEYAEEYVDANSSKDDKKRLTEVIQITIGKWLDECNIKPNFWTVEYVKEYNVITGEESQPQTKD